VGGFRKISSGSDLQRGERLLFGEVVSEQSPLSGYVTLLYDKAEVVFDRKLPDYAVNSYQTMDSVGQSAVVVDKRGGAFAVASPGDAVYLLGLRIRGTGVAQAIRFVWLRARIAPTLARCVYVGTIVLQQDQSGLHAEIRDDLYGALQRNHGDVTGCIFRTELAEPVPLKSES
jgi:hypothetical protein